MTLARKNAEMEIALAKKKKEMPNLIKENEKVLLTHATMKVPKSAEDLRILQNHVVVHEFKKKRAQDKTDLLKTQHAKLTAAKQTKEPRN